MENQEEIEREEVAQAKRVGRSQIPLRRRLLIIAGVGLAALVAVLVFLPRLLPDSFLHRKVLEALQNNFTCAVDLKAVRFERWTQFTVEGLLIQGATVDDEPPLLLLPRARITAALFPLLWGEFRLKQVQIEEPAVALLAMPGGKWNFTGIVRKTSPTRKAPALSLRELSVTGGTFRCRRAPEGQDNVIRDILLDASAVSDGLYGYSMKLNFGNSDGVRVESEGFLLLPRSLGGGGDRPSRIELQVRDTHISVVAGPEPAESLELRDTSLDFVCRAGEAGFEFDRAKLSTELNRVPLELSVRRRGESARSFRFGITGGDLQLVPIVRFIQRVRTHFASAQTELTAPRPWHDGLAVEGDGMFSSLSAGEFVFSSANFHLTLEDGVVRIDPANAKYSGGLLHASAELDRTARPQTWKYSLTAKGVRSGKSLKPILRAILPPVRVLGDIALEIEHKGAGLTPESILHSMEGTADAHFGDGKIVSRKPPSFVTRVFPVLDTTELPFNESVIHADIKGPRIDLNLRFNAKGLGKPDTYARGYVDLEEKFISFEFGLDFLSNLGVRLREGSALAGKTDVPIKIIKGKFTEVKSEQWLETKLDSVVSLTRQILIDDPIVLINPNMSVQEKARYFKGRLKSLLGTAYKPFEVLLKGGKFILKGAAGTGWKVLKLLPGIGNNDAEEETDEKQEEADRQ